MFTRINNNDAINFLLPRHYSGRKPPISYAFGIIENKKIVAVCTFGKPASNNLCYGVCGKELSPNVIELNRLCRLDDYNKQLSEFVAWCLNELKKIDNFIVVSFSDMGMNHNGYIYQALNFLYTGESAKRTDWFDYTNRHPRTLDNPNNGIRRIRSTKHRYIYFVGDKRFKKLCRQKLNYPIQPYPKGENKKYKLGEYQNIEIIENGINKTIKVENNNKILEQLRLF
jgi:hypothetical protein